MNLRKGAIMFTILLSMHELSMAQKNDPALQVSASYTGDLVGNFKGGIKSGVTYLGLADLFLNLATEKAGWWSGGEFLIHGSNTHGGEPTANLVGDFQGVSNIEAGNHTFLYELWYKQTLSNLSITIGLQDLNTEFAATENATAFINSSFGIHSVIADNIPAPIFPLTSPGITLCWHTSEKTCLKTAVYKGCPVDFDANSNNLKWNLNYMEGFLWVSEFQYNTTSERGDNNQLKAGGFYHSHCPDQMIGSDNLQFDYGFYLIGDHQFRAHSTSDRGPSLFYQLGVSPRNTNYGYLGVGSIYKGLIRERMNDEAGIALAYGALDNQKTGGDEAVLEFLYKIQISDHIFVQPDLQYVIHPGGTGIPLENAVYGTMRLGIDL